MFLRRTGSGAAFAPVYAAGRRSDRGSVRYGIPPGDGAVRFCRHAEIREYAVVRRLAGRTGAAWKAGRRSSRMYPAGRYPGISAM